MVPAVDDRTYLADAQGWGDIISAAESHAVRLGPLFPEQAASDWKGDINWCKSEVLHAGSDEKHEIECKVKKKNLRKRIKWRIAIEFIAHLNFFKEVTWKLKHDTV